MNIGIILVDFSPDHMGGVETYVRNLVSWLAVNDHDNRYTLVCTDQNVGYFDAIIDKVETLIFKNSKKSPQRLMRSFIRKMFRTDLIQVKTDQLGLDLLHNPFTSVRCIGAKTPLIVTFHDLQHRYYPEFFRSKDVAIRDRNSKKAALESGYLIADSNYTKESLLESYGVADSHIQVVHLGVGKEYKKLDDISVLEKERKTLDLMTPFLYYPAATWLHKNHANLLKAMKILYEQYNFDGELVLTGVATKAKDSLLTRIVEMGLQNKVRVLGYLPYEKLPLIYNLARLTVFPSLFEGFGMPIIESMACGCPVACSNVTSLPEVAGDAAQYFDPTSPQQIANVIFSLWSNEDKLIELGKKGIKQANLFSWDLTAQRTLEVYKHVYNRKNLRP